MLDIYYETSTSGLVKDLNEMMKDAAGGPQNIGWDTDNDTLSESTSINLSENTAINGTVGTLGASDDAGSALSGTVQWNEISLIDSAGNNISEKITVQSNGVVTIDSGFAFQNSSADTYTLRVRVVHSSGCLLYTSPSPRDVEESRMPSSA